MRDLANTLRSAGFVLKGDPIANGKIHRAYFQGDKKGSLNAWYVLFPNPLAGAYGHWKSGLSEKWAAHRDKPMTLCQKRALRAQMAKAQAERQEQEAQKHALAQSLAQRDWGVALPAFAHPYLQKKRVKGYGLRVEKQNLLVPLCDASGALWSIQTIDAQGGKRFQTGGKIKSCFCPIEGTGESLLLCEGFATGASLRAATGLPVACAMNAGNLESVALALRQKYPTRPIVICGDDDTHLPLNIGRVKATQAASAIGAKVIFPQEPYGDFNDWHNALAATNKRGLVL